MTIGALKKDRRLYPFPALLRKDGHMCTVSWNRVCVAGRTGSSPDDALGVSPRRPAVEGVVEGPEGPVDAQALHPGRRLLLLFEEGVGDEVGHL